MKIKNNFSEGHIAFVSVDGRFSEEIKGQEIKPKKTITICGNPIDPWAINVTIEL
jgi:hypothetical protein